MFAEQDAYGGYCSCLMCGFIYELTPEPLPLLGTSSTRSATTTETWAKSRPAVHATKTLDRYKDMQREERRRR